MTIAATTTDAPMIITNTMIMTTIMIMVRRTIRRTAMRTDTVMLMA